MENLTLQELLEADREMLEANLAKDRSPAAAQAALEKEIDRVLYRCLEQYEDARMRSAAQAVLQAMKNTLPLMDSVGEAHEWKKTIDLRERRKKPRPAALAFLFAGILLILATVLALHFSGGGFVLSLSLLRAVLPALGGMACLFWAGVLTGRPEKKKTDAPAVRTEFLIDVEKVWRLLHAAMMLADNTLAILEYPQASCTVRCTSQEPNGYYRRQLVVCGSEGTVEIKPLERPTILSYAKREEFRGAEIQQNSHPDARQYLEFPMEGGRYDAQMRDFALAVAGEIENPFDYEHELAVHRTVLKACGLPID